MNFVKMSGQSLLKFIELQAIRKQLTALIRH